MGLNARSIGLKIQQARVAKGMTQKELATALGIDRGSVNRWETGRSVPRQVGIPQVAKILGQSPEWLLEGSGDFNAAAETIEVLRSERRTLKAIRDEVKKLNRAEKKSISKKPYVTSAKIDRKALEDITAAWNSAKPEARLLAALLVTGDWTYQLKLLNREVAIDKAVLEALGRKPA